MSLKLNERARKIHIITKYASSVKQNIQIQKKLWILYPCLGVLFIKSWLYTTKPDSLEDWLKILVKAELKFVCQVEICQ